MKQIPLTQGKYAIVDDEDYDWLVQYKWHYTNGYAFTRTGSHSTKDRMHRMVINAPAGLEVDHINGDTLNNTKANLRACSRQKNIWNSANRVNSISTYKGVTKHKLGKGYWRARIYANGKNIHLGLYPTEYEAAEAYDEAAKEYFGEFARLNKIEGGYHS